MADKLKIEYYEIKKEKKKIVVTYLTTILPALSPELYKLSPAKLAT